MGGGSTLCGRKCDGQRGKRGATLSGSRLRGSNFASGGGWKFFGRRILGSEGRFGRIRVRTAVSARFWKKINFWKKIFLDFEWILCGARMAFWQDFCRGSVH